MPFSLNGISRFLFGMHAIRIRGFMGCNRKATSFFVYVAILCCHPLMSKRNDASFDRHAPRWNRLPAKAKGKDACLNRDVAKWKVHAVKSKRKGASIKRVVIWNNCVGYFRRKRVRSRRHGAHGG
jgi:hypothetical protein